MRNCDGVCQECCPVYCGSNEYSKKDSDGCDYCEECPTPTETVCDKNAITYDVNGCPEQGYEKCSDGMVCENGACRCPYPAQTFNKVTNKCECIFVPIGGNPDTCECYAGQDLVDGICVDPCPDALGMTGFRNSDGQCLCNTEAGYKEISNNNTFCECDEGRNYFNAPDGSCLTCINRDREFYRNYWGDSSKINRSGTGIYYRDSESAELDVWFCGYWKICENGVSGCYYNPSTKNYCPSRDHVLKKDSNGNFVCSLCSSNRTGDWGSCNCVNGSLWNSQTNQCENKCPGNIPYNYIYFPNGIWTYIQARSDARGISINGQCTYCPETEILLESGECVARNACNPNYGIETKGSTLFTYATWEKNTPESCHKKRGEGRHVQSNDPASSCYWGKGCYNFQENLPTCSYGELISDCVCPSGSKTGYCCALSQIATSSGCETCSGNTVPNSDKTTCEPCAMGTVPNAGKCVACPAGEVVSYNGTSCYTCPEGYEPNENQTRCI